MLGDFVGPIGVLRDAIEALRSEKRHIAFFQVSRRTASALANAGFSITRFGTEVVIDLQSYSLSGTSKQNIRTARNKASKVGIQVFELTREQVDLAQCQEISHRWLDSKTVRGRELAFLARPMVYEDERGVRKFYAMKGAQVLGFVHFNPLYQNGETIGYVADIQRFLPEAPKGIGYAVIANALEQFQKEGARVLSLGLCPFKDVQLDEFRDSKTARLLLQLCWDWGSALYSFQGLAQHKAEWRGQDQPIYMASNGWLPVLDVLCVFRLCRVI